MKRLLSFISALLILGASAAFADVSVKKLDDGKIEVTFFYGNPRAQEVLLAGDFTDWQNGAVPMEKGEKGFSYTKIVAPGTVMKYKFISDGNWTEDLREPDKCDDGFGGHNGLVDVDVLTAGGSDAGASKKKASLKFATWSMLGAQAKWGADSVTPKAKPTDFTSAGLNLTSYVKFSGTALPGLPVYVELAVAEKKDFNNLYQAADEDGEGGRSILDGLTNLGVDLLFDPVYYWGGEAAAKTYLGHFKFGLESDWLNYTTGYKYAKLPPHNINNWTTIDKEWEAGYSEIGGFSYFELGSALRQIGPLSINAAIAPNKSADRKGGQYGLFSWIDLSVGPAATIGLQYNGAYGKTFDTIFGHSYEHDIIAGYKGIFGPVSVKANALYNIYGDGDLTKVDGVTFYSKYIPANSDVGSVDAYKSGFANLAATADVSFSNDLLFAKLGARVRGVQANMMYVEEGADEHTNLSDQLGDLNHLRVFEDFNIWAYYGVNLGLEGYMQMTLDKKEKSVFDDADNIEFGLRPYWDIDLDELASVNAKIGGYAQMYLNTKAPKFSFAFDQAALTYNMKFDNDVFKGFKSILVYDNRDDNAGFITMTNDCDLIADITGQIGAAVRLPKADSTVLSPFGFYVGAKKKLSVLYKPTAYVQYMFGMDPYANFNDGPTAYRLDNGDLTFKDGVTDYDGNAAVRVGLHWDL